ncbi:hypothetical protein RclHR1_01210022 [Rhizophagus clarus]|uniref:F-box domain-containing protein n=1 Tax=Rhizophagus clarus TaxID=94130 RepID=A0A2Z6QLB8_9GLOM|nr:hypothetical protein RclHR1_01210022 [Rhizophagus clarus]GES97655.1 hypothetical protein GLOIN_2v1877974 [Rhizophagus clarus]
MACLKLFSGNLPEVAENILYYLRDDTASLYSCVLVNRFLCRLAVPILWENPLSSKWKDKFHHHFLDIYFILLDDDDKKFLDKESIIIERINSFSFKPLFDYPSFIKTLSTYQLEWQVVNWLYIIQQSNLPYSSSSNQNEETFNLNNSLGINNNFNINDSLTLKNHESIMNLNNKKKLLMSKDISDVICTLLIKLFIKNNANLNNLNISILSQNNFFINLFEFIMKKKDFISDIKNLTISSKNIYLSPQFDDFLYSIPTIFSSIKNLNLNLKVNDTPLTKSLSDIIQFQSNISSITLSFTKSDIIYIFDTFKYCSNTLISLKFLECDFTNLNISTFKGLKYLTNLKYFHLINCLGFKLHVIQPLLDIPTPLKIKSLTITDGNISTNSIQLLLQKIGNYLEYLFLSIPIDFMRELVIDYIIHYCDKITFLHLNHIDYKNVPQICRLVTYFRNHLNYLTLEYKFKFFNSNALDLLPTNTNKYENQKGSSVLLKELGRILPTNLNYLNLYLSIDPSQLNDFLIFCKYSGLKKLLIRNNNGDNLQNNLNLLKDFAVGNNNLDYFAYGIEYSDTFKKNQPKLDILIKEIQPFEKLEKMKNYEDSVISIFDFEED